MLYNHLRFALRHFLRQPGYTFLNVAGLTFGLTGFLLVALYLIDEVSFDAFHRRADRIHRVVETKTSPEGKEARIASVAFNVSAGAKSQLPAVENTARIAYFGRTNVSNAENKNVFYEDFSVADQGFLEVFDFPLVEGDRASALKEPSSVVLTQQMAKKLFGNQSALGKFIKNDRPGPPYRVSGVLEDFPSNSHLQFNLLFSEATFDSDTLFQKVRATDWSSSSFTTYLLLKEGSSAAKVSQQLNQLVSQRREREQAGRRSLFLQPLRDIHFYSAGIDGLGRTGDIFYVYVFSAVALFILGIACINYVNLATARAASRAKEVGVRKVNGARRRDLIGQFLTESTLMATVSIGLAIGLVNAALPAFNAFTEKALSLGWETDYRIWLGVLLLLGFIGVVSGSYPAFLLSRFRPYSLLKNPNQTTRGVFSLRRVLVVFQFTLSIGMMIATLLVYRQLQYVRTKNLGFEKEQLLVVDINSGKVRQGFQTIKSEYAKLAGVKGATVSSRVPGEWKNLPRVKVQSAAGSPAGMDAYFLGVDEDFLKTLGIGLIKGRNFQAGSPANVADVLVNQTAAKLLGVTEATGQRLTIPSINFDGDFSPLEQPFAVRLIGITGDFNYQSLRETIAPMVMAYRENPIHSIDYFTVRLAGNGAKETIAQMETVLHSVDPGHLFEYHFLDEQWDLFYREDARRQQIFMLAALGTVFIACMGLFGLASYAAGQRTKEIGIRKVLGASVISIVTLLSKDFLRLVLIAFAVAVPLAWWAMSRWLQDFAYRIDIGWWMFALVGAFTLCIALLTVSFQAVKAALANPVKSLRTE
ncbi:MAG: ABC transporter permease [Ferruginibacter sp.]|nr:ABC transporter permease [Cytophagales bacterium]